MKAVSPEISFPELERKLLTDWNEANTFKRSMDPKLSTQIKGPETSAEIRKSYLFYDGPPFATGLPHYGHLLAGTIKDVIGRFFTMKGFFVDRRFGWDCHGLPVEFEIQKSLNLHGSKAIKEFGIDNFNEACRSIVNRYTKEWERFVERSGRWVDFDRQYRTMDSSFMESVWWVFKALHEKGLVYEGFKCVSYSPAISTPISNFEANLNYKQVQDPAVVVRGHLVSPRKGELANLDAELPISLYFWTTTPWTLPGNTACAVNKDLTYAIVHAENPSEYAVIAKDRIGFVFPELVEETKSSGRNAKIVAEILGQELVGLSYSPFFDFFENKRSEGAFTVFHGDFVSNEDGTGIVHLASFGEDDLNVFIQNKLPIIDPLDNDGVFDASVPAFEGLFFKDADPKIIAALKSGGRLVKHDVIEHSYPFCWRTDKPLIYRSISTWFVAVEKIKEKLINANHQVNWVPDHIKNGRFGNWLENARDWAVSRNRFWGTPIPLWRSDKGELYCIGSIEELEKLSGQKVDDLHIHHLDKVTFKSPKTGDLMKRVPEVLDCWFESGSMPYAQAHYPFENKESFEQGFPADFIAEGLDQTRGWFYTLMVLSAALFDKPAFKNVIVNGIILAEDGRKMSKSLKNYPPADEVMEKHGADALRLYLLSSAATRADELRFVEQGVRDVVRQTLIPLWNAHNFFVTYAMVDGWDSSKISEDVSDNLLDRWILSKLESTTRQVDDVISNYKLYAAAPPILNFIDQLTNWYIRLNRRRFWQGNSAAELEDKNKAYNTLYEVLSRFSRVLAPLAPFISEAIFQNLTQGDKRIDRDSVHLCPFPSQAENHGKKLIDHDLEEAMELFEETILLGRALRSEHDVKLRQPLSQITVVYADESALKNLKKLDKYIRDELNVKQVVYQSNEEEVVILSARLNTVKHGKTLGPKLGKQKMSELHKLISNLSTDDIRNIESGGSVDLLGETFKKDDILVSRKPKPGLKTAASSNRITIILDVNLTQELRLEGLAREFVNRVQKLRKDFGFDVTDRIIIYYMTASPKIALAIKEHANYILAETLSVSLEEAGSSMDLSALGVSDDNTSIQDIDEGEVVISLLRRQS